ncbi:MAG: Do family serine endopeptidase [Candidatus Latescibacterota bacterium]|nr:MAG: Do family serine endopeptidase [Candidatus Latescibacterota bacterium]
MASKTRSRILLAGAILAAMTVGVITGIRLSPGPVGAGRAPSLRASHQPLAADEDRGTLQLALQTQDPPAPRGSSSRFPAQSSSGMFSFADVAERVTPAVVTVFSEKSFEGEENFFHRFLRPRDDAPRIQGHGSGFIIDSEGIVVTNNHVVDGAEELTVRLKDGREFTAEIVGRDPGTDVAVLRIDASGLPTLRLGNSDGIRVGDWVVAIGSPFRSVLEHTVTVGIISAKGRGNVGLADYEEFLQTDAAINPGNSGGPLVNLEGKVVGINTAIATRNGGNQGVSFAIPITFASSIIDRLLRDGKVTRAWLGVTIRDVTPELARDLGLARPEGVEIFQVHDGGPADRAGLREGDVVMAMDGAATERVAGFRNRVSLSRPGQTVELDILRDGRNRTVEAELGELTEEILAEVRGQAPQPPQAPEVLREDELGFELAEITPDMLMRYDLNPSLEGVVVVRVERNSLADEAGLEIGDVIRSVNRRRVQSLQEFEEIVDRLPSDRALDLRIKRGSRSLTIRLDRPS